MPNIGIFDPAIFDAAIFDTGAAVIARGGRATHANAGPFYGPDRQPNPFRYIVAAHQRELRRLEEDEEEETALLLFTH